MGAAISPVYAPASSWWTFWAPTATSGSVSARASRTAASATYGGQITRVTPASRVREAIVLARSPASAGVVCIFQLAATITSRMGPNHARGLHGCCRRGGFGLGEAFDALEGPLDGRTVQVEAFRELGQGRLGCLAASVGNEADAVRLRREAPIRIEDGDRVELATRRGDGPLEIGRLGIEHAVQLAPQGSRDLSRLQFQERPRRTDPAQERADGLAALPGHDAPAAAQPRRGGQADLPETLREGRGLVGGDDELEVRPATRQAERATGQEVPAQPGGPAVLGGRRPIERGCLAALRGPTQANGQPGDRRFRG